MSHLITRKRAERRAAPKPAARRHEGSTGAFKSTLSPSGDRAMYSSTEG